MITHKLLSVMGRLLGYSINPAPKTSGNIFPVGDERLRSEADFLTSDMLHDIIDAAESKRPERLFRIYKDMVFRDSHVQTEFGKRLIAVAGDPDVLTPVDDTPEAAELRDKYQLLINDLGVKFINLKLHLLKSSFWPVSVAEKVFRPCYRSGWYYTIDYFKTVDATALKYDDPDGIMRIATGDIITPAYIIPTDNNYIIHRGNVLSSEPDYLGGPARSLLFWFLFKSFDRDWWVSFMEKWGQPFLKGKYDPADPDAKYSLIEAFQAARRLFGIAVSKETEVEIAQVATQNADVFEKFHAIATAEISKLILGQTISATSTNVGFGGGQAAVHEAVRQDYRQFDSLLLSHTIRDQLFIPLAKMNAWNPDLVPYITFGGGTSDAEKSAMGTLLQNITTAGLEITDDGIPIVSDKLGIPLQRRAVQPPSYGFAGFSTHATHDREIPFSATRPRPANIRSSAAAALAANEAICEKSLAPYKKALGDQYKPILRLLSTSSTRAEFLTRLKNLNLETSPDAVAVLEDAMSAAAANGILQINNRLNP